MSPTQAGAVMRYADELADLRAIPLAACALLHRLIFKYRPKGGRVVCVSRDELAGTGRCKDTIDAYIGALEAVHLLVKEKWGVVVAGRWRQRPNRYHLRTVEEALAASMAAGDEPGEPEIVHCTVSLPPCESTFSTSFRVIEKDSSLLYLPLEGQEAAQHGGAVSDDSDVPGTAPGGEGEPAGDGGGPAGTVSVLARRPAARPLARGVSGRNDADPAGDEGQGADLGQAVGQVPGNPGADGAGRPAGGRRGWSWLLRLAPHEPVCTPAEQIAAAMAIQARPTWRTLVQPAEPPFHPHGLADPGERVSRNRSPASHAARTRAPSLPICCAMRSRAGRTMSQDFCGRPAPWSAAPKAVRSACHWA